MSDFLIWFSLLIPVVLLPAELIWYFRRTARAENARLMLLQAKQEARQVAQLSLNNPHPQIQISQTGKILFANPAALALFPGISEQGFEHGVLQAVRDVESREITFEGKAYHQTITKTQLGEGDAYAVYCFDITYRKQYEKALKEAHQRAEKMREAAEIAKEARGEFLANMSHELRTPMNGIIGLSDVLQEAGLPGDQQKLIEAVNSSARNLLILLNDILDFSKIEAGELTIENIPFDCRKMVSQIKALQEPVASRKSLDLACRVGEGVPARLVGDPARLQQILNNLVGNALKFTMEGSVNLDIEGEKDEAANTFLLRLTVQDTGVGIPPDKQTSIFEKFRQADASTSRQFGGTGLGLAITRDLVRMMGGKIGLNSEPGKGSKFTVSIPMDIYEKKKSATEYEREEAPRVGKGINLQADVLIVDDHPVNLLFLRQIITGMGFSDLDEAASGKQALECLQQKMERNEMYDLILMDCQMPEMDGFEAAQRIHNLKLERKPVIIAVTADAMKGAKERCLKAGMDDYISKPVEKDKLVAVLERWIPNPGIKETAAQRWPIDQKQPAGTTQGQSNSKAKESERLLESTSEEKITPDSSSNKSGSSISIGQRSIQTSSDIQRKENNIPPPVDLGLLVEFTDGNAELEKQIIEVFSENLETDIEQLKKSYHQKDYTGWDHWVHKLYGACSHIGALDMAALCDKGQSMSHDGEDKEHQVEKLHHAILKEHKRVRDYLNKQ